MNSFEFDSTVSIVCNCNVPKHNSTKVTSHDSIFTTSVAQVVLIVSDLRRLMPMEDTKTVISNWVSDIVAEFTQLWFCWLNVWIEGGSYSSVLIVHPITIIWATCSAITNEYVVWVSNPEATRSLVSIEQRKRWFGASNNIVLDQILCFCCIFNKNGVTHHIPVAIALHSQVFDSVDSCATIVASHDCIVSHIWLVNSTNHMEVNWIFSK